MGIVGVLALALGGLLWRSWNTAAPTTPTTSSALAVVTTTGPPATTSTTTPSPTTTTAEQRIAEVESILTNLWFGWFDAIYRRDSGALWSIVATTPYHEAGVAAMDDLSFDGPPSSDGLALRVDQILLDRADCLVVENTISMPFLEGDPSDKGVDVLWLDDSGGWRFASAWVYPEDLWMADCDEVVREETP